MGLPKDLNQSEMDANAPIRAIQYVDTLTRRLTDEEQSEDSPFYEGSQHFSSSAQKMRAMVASQIIQGLPLDVLDKLILCQCSPLMLAEMAAAYQKEGESDTALTLLKRMLDGDREDPFLLIDYWIARYAEWLADAGSQDEGERFLLDEYKNPRKIEGWQVAQKLAAFHIDQGNLEKAEDWVKIATKDKPDNPFNHYLRGLLRPGDEQQ
ncbi:MAG: hypothetical protein HQL98_16180 [Magnetococcales bacterium]|nr:hypothetical protein [Magnetococcales bacterium]